LASTAALDGIRPAEGLRLCLRRSPQTTDFMAYKGA